MPLPQRCGSTPETHRGWPAGIRRAVMDTSGPYKAVFDTMLPHAEQVIDPFHVVKDANKLSSLQTSG